MDVMAEEVSALGTKVCTKCGVDQPLTHYYPHKGMSDGLKKECKTCRGEYSREYYQKNAERVKAASRLWRERNPDKVEAQRRVSRERNLNILYKYGLSQVQFEQMVLDQNGRCKICERAKKLVVDHNHDTGEVRGLLCHGCNTGLARVENVEFRERALAYLEVYQ